MSLEEKIKSDLIDKFSHCMVEILVMLGDGTPREDIAEYIRAFIAKPL